MNDLLDLDQVRKIALLNDAFRTTFLGGTVIVTAGLQLLGNDFVKAALLAVREFKTFTTDNDPHGEHDFGALKVEDRKLFWKIDYFDPTMTSGATDPGSADTTRRVLTVMPGRRILGRPDHDAHASCRRSGDRLRRPSCPDCAAGNRNARADSALPRGRHAQAHPGLLRPRGDR